MRMVVAGMDVIRGKTLGSDQGLIYFLRRASIAHGCSTMVAGIHDHEEKEDVDDQEEEDDVDDHEEEEDVDDHQAFLLRIVVSRFSNRAEREETHLVHLKTQGVTNELR